MTILYLEHPEADFLSAMVYLGLCEILGADEVVVYPFKRSYHGETHYYPDQYSDVPRPGGVTAPFDWFTAPPGGREWSRDEVIANISNFHLIVLASPRKVNVAALTDLIQAVGRDKLPHLVILDGEDYSRIRTDLIARFRPRTYFKRELLPGAGGDCRILPCPFASQLAERSAVDKTIDVFFIGGNTWPARVQACDALQRAFGDRFVGGMQRHVPYAEYIDTIASAKVAISVRGWGNDTTRFWEIPSTPETLLVADKLPMIKPHPFEHGVHALYFDNNDHLVELVRQALADEPWRRRIAAAGNAHLRAYHTVRARAQYVLDESLR